MARQEVGYDPSTEVLRPTVSPNFQMVQPQSVESRLSDSKGYQLAEALGSATAYLQKWNEQYEARKTDEQVRKIPAYVEQFKKDWDGGAVSQAQIRDRFPETVPVIAARIAEAMGDRAGEEAARGIMSKVMEDDSLKLDGEARAAYIEEQKQQYVTNQSGKNNEFYASGFLKSFDGMKNQYENQFMQQTAAYQQKIQEESFTKQIESALLNGGDPEAIDGVWRTSSSLNDITRKKLTVETARDIAIATDDPSVLDRVPTKLLNADLKKDLQTAREQVQDLRMKKLNYANTIQERQREADYRNVQKEVIETVAQGGSIDPRKYKNNPQAFQFATSVMNTPLLPEAVSVANTEKLRSSILRDSTVGSSSSAEQMVDKITAQVGVTLNPADASKLINEVPKLVEGNILMKDDMVQSMYSTRLNPVLEALEKSPLAQMEQLLAGRNLRAEVMRAFDDGLRASFMAEFEDSKKSGGAGQWPIGQRKLQLVREQVEIAERLISNYTNINNLEANTNNITGNNKPAAGNKTPSTPTGKKKEAVPGMPGVYKYVD